MYYENALMRLLDKKRQSANDAPPDKVPTAREKYESDIRDYTEERRRIASIRNLNNACRILFFVKPW